MKLVDRLCRAAGRKRGEVKSAMHLQVSIAEDESSLRKQAEKWMDLADTKDPHDMISCGTPAYFIELLQKYSEGERITSTSSSFPLTERPSS